MRRARMTRTIGILFAAALVAAGCGGGGDEMAPADAGVSPVPGADATQTQIGDAGVGGTGEQQLDENGMPIDPAVGGSELGATGSIPTLSGGDIGGGLGAVDSTPIFSPGAVGADKIAETETPQDSGEANHSMSSDMGATPEKPKPAAPQYAGAKFSVDGVVVTVDKKGAFPKNNPVFRLLSVDAGSVEVELIAGEFTTGGGSGVVLDKGELVSLVNASEQLTYRVKYLRPVTSTNNIEWG